VPPNSDAPFDPALPTRADAAAVDLAYAALAARVDAVLVRPSHAGNVGAAARALRVMGLSGLRLVEPRHRGFATAPEALAFASGATEVLEAAAVHANTGAALADTTLAIAVSAAGREFAAPPLTPEEAARRALDELRADASHRVAFVFGNERTGLSIADAQRCQLLCSIPTDARYGSLNLAQAVQVVGYCLRREWRATLAAEGAAHAAAGTGGARVEDAGGAPGGRAPVDPGEAPASGRGHASLAQIEATIAPLERALVTIGFLDPASPKRLMPRLRRLFARTRLSVEEVDILRGIAAAMIARGAAAGSSGPSMPPEPHPDAQRSSEP
jgi:tRNA/rRNA methyltransferase